MLKLYNTEQCRQLDQLAQQQGVSAFMLMQRAAKFALQGLQTRWPQAKHLTILCGPGNNGGDGYALAKLAHLAGYHISLVQLGEAPRQGAAQQARHEAERHGLLSQELDFSLLSQQDVIIDALFGIGLNRPLDNAWQTLIRTLNQLDVPILALDIPSGLEANTGRILGAAIAAELTTCFIVPKIGLYINDGVDYAGLVISHHLDIEADILAQVQPLATSWQNEDLPAPRARKHNSHKGDYGTALLIGGNVTMLGALALAGQACLRSGTGLVKLISRAEHTIALTQIQPELMCYDERHSQALQAQADVIAIGPGLGDDDWAWHQFERVCNSQKNLVLDADALNLLALQPLHYERWILTPHPGEAGRLLGKPALAIQHDRVGAIEALHKRYGGVIVLKGAGTLIYDGEQLALCRAGNPGMAVGGMGDVLTGIIAGLVAQGLELFEAARLGVEMHARCADRIAAERGERSLLPSDVIQAL